MNKCKKCSLEELKEVWENFGWVVFNNFEDYVVEVRKVESELQNGKITMEKLKEDNNEKIDQIQSKFEAINESSLNIHDM